MSRVGRLAIEIPSEVKANLAEGVFSAQGKLGTLSYKIPQAIKATLNDGKLTVEPLGQDKKTRMLWGTSRARLSNVVKGVTEGFSVDLEIEGVGYRASVQGQEVVLLLGFSHEVRYKVPKEVKVVASKPTQLRISGADKQQVGQIAAEIRSYRPPEPYKGKGVRRANEFVLRKEGKKK